MLYRGIVRQRQICHRELFDIFGLSFNSPNPDKPEKWPQRHKAKQFAKIYLCVLCLGGENVLPQNSQLRY